MTDTAILQQHQTLSCLQHQGWDTHSSNFTAAASAGQQRICSLPNTTSTWPQHAASACPQSSLQEGGPRLPGLVWNGRASQEVLRHGPFDLCDAGTLGWRVVKLQRQTNQQVRTAQTHPSMDPLCSLACLARCMHGWSKMPGTVVSAATRLAACTWSFRSPHTHLNDFVVHLFINVHNGCLVATPAGQHGPAWLSTALATKPAWQGSAKEWHGQQCQSRRTCSSSWVR